MSEDSEVRVTQADKDRANECYNSLSHIFQQVNVRWELEQYLAPMFARHRLAHRQSAAPEGDWEAITTGVAWLREEARIQLGPTNDLHIDEDQWEHSVLPMLDALDAMRPAEIFAENANISTLTENETAALSAAPARPAGGVEEDAYRIKHALFTWFENHTGFGRDSEDEIVEAHYGGHWISINLDRLARHLAGLEFAALSRADGRVGEDFYAGRYAERCGDVAKLTARTEELEAALRPFVGVRDQFPETVKLIDPKLDGLSGITVTVTKAQFLAAARALDQGG